MEEGVGCSIVVKYKCQLNQSMFKSRSFKTPPNKWCANVQKE